MVAKEEALKKREAELATAKVSNLFFSYHFNRSYPL